VSIVCPEASYEAATGVQPFDAATSAMVFDRIFHLDPPSPLCLNPALPAGMAHVITKALSKPRRTRYQTADEILDDLRGVSTRAVAATA